MSSVGDAASAQGGAVHAIVVAAGRSERMGGVDNPVDKTVVPLRGKPLAAWAVGALGSCDAITSIVLVSGERNHEALQAIGEAHGGGKVTAVVAGGQERRDSVANGLRALSAPAGDDELVLVHDAARPLLNEPLIREGVELAATHGAAIAGARVSDTIKRVATGGVIESTIDRETLRAVQTPQVFRRTLLERAHAAPRDGAAATDDAMLIEALGHAVVVYESRGPNLKVTNPADLTIAAALLAVREEAQGAG